MMLNLYPIVCILAGTPQDPYCGYSRTFIEILNKLEIRYKSYDILKDDKLRGWLRVYSGWRTFPQLYIYGKIIGGCDVLKGLTEENKIMSMIPEECQKNAALKDLNKMISSNMTVLFGEVVNFMIKLFLKGFNR